MTDGRPLGRDDWEALTVSALADGGLAAVHIDELARRLKVTKGSFYWHFDSRDELLAASLARWRDASVRRLERLRAVSPPHERLRVLAARGVQEPEHAHVEVALSGVVDDERVTPFLEEVTTRRLCLLEDTFRELGADRVEERALLAHALYVGLLHTLRVDPLRARDPGALVRLWLALVSP